MVTLEQGCNLASLCKAVWATIAADSPSLIKVINEGKSVSTTQFISGLSSATHKTLADMVLASANWTKDNLTFLPDESEERVIIATKVASAHTPGKCNVYFHIDK